MTEQPTLHTTGLSASQVALVVKNPPVNAGDIRDASLIPGSGRSPREGNGNPLQYSCLENPMDSGAWWATVHEVAKVKHKLTTKPPQQKYNHQIWCLKVKSMGNAWRKGHNGWLFLK